MDTREYALESMDEGVLILSPKGDIEYANPFARNIFDLSESDNKIFSRIMAEGNRRNDEIIDFVADTITGKTHRYDRMVRYTDKAGKTYSLMTGCTEMEDGEFVFTFSDRTELVAESIKRKDAISILTMFFVNGCIWSVGVSVWIHMGEPFPVGALTNVVELLGIAGLFVLLKLTDNRVRDYGLSFANIGPTMKRTVMRLLLLLTVFSILKLIIMEVRPDYFPDDSPFWDWSQADIRLVKYMITAFVQEFLARGGVQVPMSRVYGGVKGQYFSVFLTSLYFMSLHIQYGLAMMFGAGALSILLSYMYKKDGNIYGVVLFHYCFGKFADFLLLLQ